jgi:hypothetical protein
MLKVCTAPRIVPPSLAMNLNLRPLAADFDARLRGQLAALEPRRPVSAGALRRPWRDNAVAANADGKTLSPLLAVAQLRALQASVRMLPQSSPLVNDDCPICMEPLELAAVVSLPCDARVSRAPPSAHRSGHAFHWRCVRAWLGKCSCCPVCRQPIRLPQAADTVGVPAIDGAPRRPAPQQAGSAQPPRTLPLAVGGVGGTGPRASAHARPTSAPVVRTRHGAFPASRLRATAAAQEAARLRMIQLEIRIGIGRPNAETLVAAQRVPSAPRGWRQ